MRLCLVEDRAAAGLEPISLTRAVYELRLGAETLGGKIARALRAGLKPGGRGAVIRSHLAAVHSARDPRTAVNDRGWLAASPLIVANARWVPPADLTPPIGDAPWVGLCEGVPACAFIGPARVGGLEPDGVDDWFETLLRDLPSTDLGGEWIHRPWDLVAKNSEHLHRDFDAHREDFEGRIDPKTLALALVGPADRLVIHESARIDPYTVFDTTNGPITIESGVLVQPFTRVEGPCHIGRDTQLFRANLRGGVTLGPNCRIGGEVEHSIVQGHSNKYHEGFLGHAYVGEWVNLGAITSNSDLRNDYGEVSVPLSGDPVPTGQLKVGCFIGDHTRTGLGSMINTGTSVGVMCNLLPAGPLLPKHVPSFGSVLYGRIAPGFPLEQMFATARTVMGRRGQVFSAVDERLYLDLYEQTRPERERAFQRSHDRRTDHWPISSSSARP